jgi:hypothetical protein
MTVARANVPHAHKMISFNATCPNGHTGTHSFYRDRLSELVGLDRVQLWCARCDTQWEATSEELQALRRLLRIQE